MTPLDLKPTHKPVQTFYSALAKFENLGVSHEGAVKSAFHGLLDHCARQHDWTLVPEWEIRRPRQFPIRVDGVLLDNRPDDPEYIVRLIGQVVTVSLETVKVVKGLLTMETTVSV
jgi:hypothetical protein